MQNDEGLLVLTLLQSANECLWGFETDSVGLPC